jgi:Sec-independent protein secretion pathway component TatC
MPTSENVRARLDRWASAALSQTDLATWSWPRALATLVVAAVAAAIIYVAVYSQIDWIIALAVVYGLALWRARVAHADYLKGSGR